jgi:hypothetical protein
MSAGPGDRNKRRLFMRRMGIGMATVLAIWFGSAAIAEAQSPTITPTGPTKVVAGDSHSAFTASVYLPNPCVYRVRLWIKKGATEIHYSETVYPNPGTSYASCSKNAQHNQAVNAGDVLDYIVKLKVGTVWYDQSAPWQVTVTSTRPSSKSSTLTKSNLPTLQSVDRDRRRE